MTPSLVKKKTSIERFNKQVINLHILKQFVIIAVILFLNLQATSMLATWSNAT